MLVLAVYVICALIADHSEWLAKFVDQACPLKLLLE